MYARDIMTRNVQTIRADADLLEAISLMLDRGISGLPVVDEANALVGMVTEGDLLRRVETGTTKTRPRWLDFLLGPGRLAAEYVAANSRRVGDLMTSEVVSVGEDTPLDQIVALIESKRIKRVPVVEGSAVVGMVSRKDLLRALRSAMTRRSDGAPASDAEIHDRIVTEFARQPWAPMTGVTIDVANGVVVLEGTIADEQDRAAMRVLVENIPGVKSVRDELTWIEPLSGAAVGPTV
ncbi:MAG: CBS domain-containing protein [Proteobacteria bacterium]|nr:CBS domain-containing protein [Pseudomonadota bacterium]